MANPVTNIRGKDEPRMGSTGPTAADVKHKAEEVGGTVVEKGKEAASAMADKAKEAASTVGHKAEEAASAVGGGMRSLAGTIREHTPQGGMLGSAGSTVAGSLESGGRYLQEEGLSGMMDDLTNLIRRNPLPAVLVGIGIGFLLARTTSRS